MEIVSFVAQCTFLWSYPYIKNNTLVKAYTDLSLLVLIKRMVSLLQVLNNWMMQSYVTLLKVTSVKTKNSRLISLITRSTINNL